MNQVAMMKEIQRLKKQKKGLILSHLYQEDEIQELADFTGDSLELSQKAATAEAEVLIFCGVRFMAETAKILSPQKTVLIPVEEAGCPLADMIEAQDVMVMKEKHPKAAVVCYVNSSAEVKAISDYCCTSSNAAKIVRNIPEEEIIFVPDKNLGSFVAKQVPEKRIILWEGFCPTHNRVTGEDVDNIKKIYPQALLLVHPECRKDVYERADFVGSTSAILKYAKESNAWTMIIGTEKGSLYRLKKENPEKEFVLLSSSMICPDMKKISLDDVYRVLSTMENKVEIDDNIRKRASLALNKMLQYS